MLCDLSDARPNACGAGLGGAGHLPDNVIFGRQHQLLGHKIPADLLKFDTLFYLVTRETTTSDTSNSLAGFGKISVAAGFVGS